MDEILDSLDPENSSIAVDIMKTLSKEYCVLLISHTHKDWVDADEILKL
jgi:ABC-type transport system involved in cytochrome bd biosynthesis fused ATPase/permease subunit